jgi:predicted nucleotidyltransferase
VQSAQFENLPQTVRRILTEFVDAARSAFSDSLVSVLLYGSGAEGKIRDTSDVNVMLVLRSFEPGGADQLREPLRVAHAAVRLKPMFILESELADSAKLFAVKYADILRRRLVLYGSDPMDRIVVERADIVDSLKQSLLNLTIRLRGAYVLRGLREEQILQTIADTAGPLRSCAAALLQLEGRPAASPKEALATLASQVETGAQAVAAISLARERKPLPAGQAPPTLLALIELASQMRSRAEPLS